MIKKRNTDRTTIYLAGGMKEKWRNDLKNKLLFTGKHPKILDPVNNKTDIPKEYTTVDIFWIDHCDILFGYMEKDNPSGIGLAAEIGYAKAKGKTVILVNELEDNKFKFIENLADVTYRNFNDGVEFLIKIIPEE